MLADYRRRVDALLAKRSHAVEKVRDERAALEQAEKQAAAAIEAQQILQTVSQTVQRQTHDRIAGVVSHCLAAVFGEDAYGFRIHFPRKRGRTEARLVFVRGENELHPRSASGGGCIDIAAFGARLASLMLCKPSPRRVLIIDEPFRNVSKEHKPKLVALIERLSKEMGIQFIFVTHIEGLEIGNIIEVG